MGFATSFAARRRFRVLLILGAPALLALIALILASCASGDKTLDAVDPNAVALNPTFDQVNAIIHNKCVMCHDSGSGGKDSGGNDFRLVVENDDMQPFETCTQIVAEGESILERIQDNTMPPGAMPRLSSEDRLIIQRWVENGKPAPCNPTP
ncbi:MAG TPA: hypothetical protein VFH33_07530 [Candidatus Krumholzibacteria bacterium]|nr:hypothetical protein [Candidatus Krumholzibacteria bacterium]